jgi:glycolate oxidase FAD binding subunit
MDVSVDDFAAAVGSEGDVSVQGLATRGGGVNGVRTVSAPAGITRIDAAEMVVECGAATPMAELADALAEHGQTVSLPVSGTVGGALAVGRSDITRLAHGPARDVLLQTHFVSASGRATKAGGPTVKNVSGFDLCRLFVGARGTLGFFGDVILRTRPLPRHSRWFTSTRDPMRLLEALYRPVSILWDGSLTWVRLDGDPADVSASADEHDLDVAEGPPALPTAHRWSVSPSGLLAALERSTGPFVAEIGVGVVHHTEPPPEREPDTPTLELHRRIKTQFDPTGRLNPGVDPFRRD